MIYGPAVMNAEVICYKDDWEDVKTVGVGQGREQEKRLAEENYPQIEAFREVTQKGILYALEDRQVDAVIQDVTKAYYSTMYGYDLTDAELADILEGALPKAA